MKRIIILFCIYLCLTLFGCVMCGPFSIDYACDIKAEKTFILPFNKATLFKVYLKEGHHYSTFTEENVNDSLYYIYSPAKKANDDAVFECKIKNIGKDSSLIQTYKVVWFSIVDDDDQEYYRTLSSKDYLKLLENNFISKLKSKKTITDRFFYDNKKDHDIWETIDKYSEDSLDKVYKRRKIVSPN